MYFSVRFSIALMVSGLLASAMPVHLTIANRLAYIATHSCVTGAGLSVQTQMPEGVDAAADASPHTQASHSYKNMEKLILQTLKAINMELNYSLNEINSNGEVHDAMSDDLFEDIIQGMTRVLEFRSDWNDSSHDLTSQQVVRIKALVRMAGYVYHMQIQNPDDRHMFGDDVPHLQLIQSMLQRITCTLRNLLPNVDVTALFVNSYIPNSFYINVRRYQVKMFRMGLTLLDLHRSVKGMRISVPHATIQIN